MVSRRITRGVPPHRRREGRLGGAEQPARGQYDVSHDGRFLINSVLPGVAAQSLQIAIAENWIEELKRLAPPD